MEIRQSELEKLWFVINNPSKVGPKWCTYQRKSIDDILETIKNVMGDNGYEFKVTTVDRDNA